MERVGGYSSPSFRHKKQAKFRRRRCYTQDKRAKGIKGNGCRKVGHVMSAVGGAFFVCVCGCVFGCASGAVKKVHRVSLHFTIFYPPLNFPIPLHICT